MTRKSDSTSHLPRVAKSTLVPYDVEYVSKTTFTPHTRGIGLLADLTMELHYTSSQFQKLETPFCCGLWHRYKCEGFSDETAINLILGHTIQTRRTHGASVKRWYLFCQPRKIDPVYPTLQQVIDFFALPHLIDTSRAHARTVLNWILNTEIAKQMSMSCEVAKMCTSRVYNLLRQPRLSDQYVWDPGMVIDYLQLNWTTISYQ